MTESVTPGFSALRAPDSPELLPYLPMIYVAWADGDLQPAEIRAICSRLEATEGLDGKCRKLLGVWLDPDHRVQSTIDDDLFSAVLSPGSDNLHYTFGFGAAFKRVQLDLAADFSDLRDTVSLSAIFSF